MERLPMVFYFLSNPADLHFDPLLEWDHFYRYSRKRTVSICLTKPLRYETF